MKTVKTTEDGWGCVPELKEVSQMLSGLRNPIYEIDNCVRSSSTEAIVEDMRDILEQALEQLEYVNTDVEYETVYEN